MVFEFEKPITELENKIKELQKYAHKNKLDLTTELSFLEKKVKDKKEEVYSQLTPWQRVEIARYIKRPTSKAYIAALFDDFIEFNGDRAYSDDNAIIGGSAAFRSRLASVIGQQRGMDPKDHILSEFG